MAALAHDHDRHISKCFPDSNCRSIDFNTVATLNNFVAKLAEDLAGIVNFSLSAFSGQELVGSACIGLYRLCYFHIFHPKLDRGCIGQVNFAFLPHFLDIH